MINLMNGDCLEMMKDIPDGSVDMVLTDPPYGTIKNLTPLSWSGKGTRTDWDTVIDQVKMLNECNRILRPNGCLALFSQDPYTQKLIVEAHKNLPFSYRYTWNKNNFGNALSAKKAPVNYTEDICVFFKKHVKHDFECLHPLRPYAAKVLSLAGGSVPEINKKLGHEGAEHFFHIKTTQFSLCTEKVYKELTETYSLCSQPWFRGYSDLKACNLDFRSDLIKRMTEANPKVFNLPNGEKHKPNLLSYSKDRGHLHTTQKPVALLEDLIKTYTNEGETVLDFTMGSGSTGVAAKNLNRSFIGIELDENYYNIAKERIGEA